MYWLGPLHYGFEWEAATIFSDDARWGSGAPGLELELTTLCTSLDPIFSSTNFFRFSTTVKPRYNEPTLANFGYNDRYFLAEPSWI